MEIVRGSTGSLKTNASTLFIGTSVFFLPGWPRMTIGAVALDTGTLTVLVTPPAVVVTTVTVSPGLAPTGTGSSPPSFMAAVTRDPVAGLNACAVSPSSTVPGGMATYVTLSSAALPACATPGAREVGDPTGACGVGFGARSDTSMPGPDGCA